MRAEHEECSRRFIAGVAEMNAWRRKRGEGIIPSQGGVGVLPPLHGVKMNERADSFH